ncbi:hypothetical protein J5N97_022731 [Dioscorea zingiberensis]|uniref:Proline-tRNA ligase class II C-terminal domain-containing protein n=1 Tax=Dioscorea zingiberensis TaxID=325984 RepID=A0A9D5CBB1_9LILI|nr:hypothetical protein J5N97_022731 [Dioscorea zingiberensis]
MRQNWPISHWIRMPADNTIRYNAKRSNRAQRPEARDVEKDVKSKTKGELGPAKTLCTPFDQPELPEGTLCFASRKPSKKWTYWDKATENAVSLIHLLKT